MQRPIGVIEIRYRACRACIGVGAPNNVVLFFATGSLRPDGHPWLSAIIGIILEERRLLRAFNKCESSPITEMIRRSD